jgi:hypothetical protein
MKEKFLFSALIFTENPKPLSLNRPEATRIGKKTGDMD